MRGTYDMGVFMKSLVCIEVVLTNAVQLNIAQNIIYLAFGELIILDVEVYLSI